MTAITVFLLCIYIMSPMSIRVNRGNHAPKLLRLSGKPDTMIRVLHYWNACYRLHPCNA